MGFRASGEFAVNILVVQVPSDGPALRVNPVPSVIESTEHVLEFRSTALAVDSIVWVFSLTGST